MNWFIVKLLIFTFFYKSYVVRTATCGSMRIRRGKKIKICWFYFYYSSHSLNTVNSRSGLKFKLHFYASKKSTSTQGLPSGQCEPLLLMEIYFALKCFIGGRTLLHNSTSLFLCRDLTLQPQATKTPLNSLNRVQWTPEQDLDLSRIEVGLPEKLDAAFPISEPLTSPTQALEDLSSSTVGQS